MTDDSTGQLSRALAAVREMRTRLEAAEAAQHEAIAIVGMGCRFPGADSPAGLWDLVRRGGDAVTETPRDRWAADALYDESPEAPGRVATRWGGFIDGVDEFDAGFFGISPREAELMDPQQRLMLEVAWEAIEDAGQTVEVLGGSATGVFMGVHSHSSDYFAMQAADPLSIDLYTGTGTSHSVVSGRISYLFDLRGPSVAVDTACSSSLVAIHLGVQSLRSGESQMAIAGGVNTMHEPTFTMVASRMRMMSPTGRCRPFDIGADGFVRSEGCGAVVLKRLSDAQRDGDRVLAVIVGSAVNQDGRSNGLTAPNSLSQEDVLARALEDARVLPESIGLIEAHGTGTPLGDPIEVEALSAVFGDGDRAVPLLLGSVKANIGHAEGAAGVAGLIKAVQAIRAGEIPRLAHFGSLNPHIDLEMGNLSIPTDTMTWPSTGEPRRAGVSSFGWSGTNAHLVIAEAPSTAPHVDDREPAASLVLPISARSADARDELADRFRVLLGGASATDARAICAAAARRRSHHPYRLSVAGRDADELVDHLAAHIAGEERREVHSGVARTDATVFVFPGQGSQWTGMSQRLLADDEVFAEALRRCDESMRPHLGWSMVERIEHAQELAPGDLDAIDVVQPMLFATQVATSAALSARGLVPDAVVGHSMGEVAAAHVAGALSLDDAALVICRRSSLLRRIAGRGAMGVVGLGPEAAAEAIVGFEDRLAVAVNNGPNSTVLSGDPAALERVFATLDERDVFCRLVKVDVASHSPQVDELVPELVADLAELETVAPQVAFMSTVTAEFETRLDSAYWGRNLRSAVRFASALRELIATGHCRVMEISPHPLLIGEVRAALDDAGVGGASVAVNWRDADEPVALASAVGAMFVDGATVDWASIHPDVPIGIDLPSYPWQHERFWIPERVTSISRGQPLVDVLGWQVEVAVDGLGVWERIVDRRVDPSWYDHRISGRPSLPASALAILMMKAASAYGVGGTLVDLRLDRLAVLDDDVPTRLQTTVDDRAGVPRVTVSTWHDGAWIEHASASPASTPVSDPTGAGTRAFPPIPGRRSDVRSDAYYDRLAAASYELGPSLRPVGDIWVDGTSAMVSIRRDPSVDRDLVTVDAVLQAALAGVSSMADGAPERMPVAIESLTRHATPGGDLICTVVVRTGSPAEADEIVVDAVLTDADGLSVTEASGIRLRRLDRAVERPDDWVYSLAWRPADDDVAERAPVAAGEFLLVGGGDIAEAVAEQLRSQGAEARVVAADRLPSASAPEDVAAIVVLEPSIEAAEPSDVATLVGRQSAGAVVMLRAIGLAVGHGGARPVTAVTRDVHRVVERDRGTGFAHSSVWGLGRALLEEQPELAGGLIDLDLSSTIADAAKVITEELLAGRRREVAWREGRGWVPRLERCRLAPQSPSTLRRDQTYLVTGGFGSIGANVAKRLVERGASHIALLGRTELPHRDEWGSIPPDGAVARRVAVVRELESIGANVHLLVADTGDERSLRSALGEYASGGWPPIRVVHHTAATFGGQLLGELTATELVEQLIPKLVGAWVLADELVDAEQLVLYSSIAALLPMPGQGAYAAGNAFLDAFAQRRRADGRAALSVQWGFWDGSSDDLEGESGQRREGATVDYKEAARSVAETRGMSGFPAADGLDLLERLLAEGVPQATVIPIDWRQWIGSRGGRPLGVASEVAGDTSDGPVSAVAGTVDLRLRLTEVAPHERIDVVEGEVRLLIAKVLKLAADRLDVTQPFGNLGMDSMMAIEIRSRLETLTGLTLSATVAWNYSTVRELGEYVLARLMEGDTKPDAGDPDPVDSSDVRSASTGNVPDVTRRVDAVSGLTEDDALRSLMGEDRS